LSVSGVFTALVIFAYIFGSIYIYRYYGFFGIPRGAMSFAVQDYMSHSLFPLILAFQIGIWAELLRYNIKNNRLFGFDLDEIEKVEKDLKAKGNKSFLAIMKAIYRENPNETIMNIFMSFFTIGFALFWIIWVLLQYINQKPLAGTVVVIIFSFSIGVLFFFSTQLLKFSFSKVYKDFSLAQFASSIATIAIYFIITIGIMAEMQACYDTTKLTKSVVAYKTELPIELQYSSSTKNLSKPLRIITINNNRLYVYLDEGFQAGGNVKLNSVYSINYSDVEYFKYIISSRENDNN